MVSPGKVRHGPFGRGVLRSGMARLNKRRKEGKDTADEFASLDED